MKVDISNSKETVFILCKLILLLSLELTASVTSKPQSKRNFHIPESISIRPFVLGRKNWLFSCTPEGAHASATIYSLIETAKANGLDPYWYLKHLFEKLPEAMTSDEFNNLLPHNVDKNKLDRPAV